MLENLIVMRSDEVPYSGWLKKEVYKRHHRSSSIILSQNLQTGKNKKRLRKASIALEYSRDATDIG